MQECRRISLRTFFTLYDKPYPPYPSIINGVKHRPYAPSLSLGSQREIFTCSTPSGEWGINGKRSWGSSSASSSHKKWSETLSPTCISKDPHHTSFHVCAHTQTWLWGTAFNGCFLLIASFKCYLLFIFILKLLLRCNVIILCLFWQKLN